MSWADFSVNSSFVLPIPKIPQRISYAIKKMFRIYKRPGAYFNQL